MEHGIWQIVRGGFRSKIGRVMKRVNSVRVFVAGFLISVISVISAHSGVAQSTHLRPTRTPRQGVSSPATPTPTPQCDRVPCGGPCLIFPSCIAGPGTACPDFIVQGECSDGSGTCECKPAQFPTPTPTPTFCVDTVLCVRGSHWSATQCRCVPDTAGTPTACVDTELCIIGFHWSPEQCTCVPDQVRHSHVPHGPSGPHAVHVPHAPHAPRGSAAQACQDSGGTVTSSLCCDSVGDFPNTCLIGACGCAPQASHEVRVCECGDTRCFDGARCASR